MSEEPKVDPSHLATDLLAQAGAGRQVFGSGQSGENDRLVGEITILTLGLDPSNHLHTCGSANLLEWQADSHRQSQPSGSASILLFGHNGSGGRAARTTMIELRAF